MKENIENIVVKSSPWDKGLLETLFFKKPEDYNESEIHFTEADNLESLMVEISAYTSKSEARRAGREGTIPLGFTEMWANKRRKIWIFNAIPCPIQ